jgi:hypothetical protein
MRTGTAGSIDGWGRGGGTQFELLKKIPDNAYQNVRRMENGK